MSPNNLIQKHGGYRHLHSFTFATIIHLETTAFCKRFIPWQSDQLGKTSGQMIGAARSGRQNIIEGSERSATSKETEIKLTDVARASLAELLGDYEIFLADQNSIPWSKNDENSKAVYSIMLPDFSDNGDTLHEYWKYYHNVTKVFDPYLRHDDSIVVANTMIIIILRTMAMLSAQIRAQSKRFLEEGGFRERMYQSRAENRGQQAAPDSDAPNCPLCECIMIKRSSAKGEFWGCSTFPKCKGTREV